MLQQTGAQEANKVPETEDVAAVNRRADRFNYETRQKIYPKLAHGTYRRLKWILMAVCLGIYYFIPFLRYDRGPDLPNQAVLLDMANNRFFMFGLEIWPQEFYYVTGLLVLATLVLFVVTAVAGRVWCGYFCPQTVWTDLMVLVERYWQGDRNARILGVDVHPQAVRRREAAVGGPVAVVADPAQRQAEAVALDHPRLLLAAGIGAVADHFCQNFCAACLCMFKIFEN